MEEEKSDFDGFSDFGFGGLGSINEEAPISYGMSEITPEFPTTNPPENGISAYERAWGRESPSWYREKEPVTEVSSREVSDYSETTDIFGFEECLILRIKMIRKLYLNLDSRVHSM